VPGLDAMIFGLTAKGTYLRRVAQTMVRVTPLWRAPRRLRSCNAWRVHAFDTSRSVHRRVRCHKVDREGDDAAETLRVTCGG